MTSGIFEASARAGITRTFEDPEESAIYARLVSRAVKITRAQRVLDVGCGAGIATLEAARAGAREVVGIDVERTSVEIACANIRQAGQETRASAHFASWQDVCFGRFPTCADLLVSNPPYGPAGIGRSVDGGFFGTSLLDDIIDHVPSSTCAVALLIGSITDPITFMSRMAARGFDVAHVFEHSVPFGRYASFPGTLRHLRSLRDQGRAFFCDVPAAPGCAPHAYLTLGLIAYRSPSAAERAEALQKKTRSRLMAYQEASVDIPTSAPKRAAS